MTKALLLLSCCLLFLCIKNTPAQTPQKKFPSPAWADTIKNPLAATAYNIAAGKTFYASYCAACHGPKGKGDGVAAAGLPKKPADHTSPFVQKQTDGALYWIITNGNNPMPAYKTTLTSTQRWQVIDYIRTLVKS